jgi:predicted transcriptional regulator
MTGAGPLAIREVARRVEHDMESVRWRRPGTPSLRGRQVPYAFTSLAQLVAPKRWEVLRVMTGEGPLAIREVARRVKRDVKSVHGDVHALLKAGVVDRTKEGRIRFPYDEIHVDFVLRFA